MKGFIDEFMYQMFWFLDGLVMLILPWCVDLEMNWRIYIACVGGALVLLSSLITVIRYVGRRKENKRCYIESDEKNHD